MLNETIIKVIKIAINYYLKGNISGHCFIQIFNNCYFVFEDMNNEQSIESNHDQNLLRILEFYSKDIFSYYGPDPETNRTMSPDTVYEDDILKKKLETLLDKITQYESSCNLEILIPEGTEKYIKLIPEKNGIQSKIDIQKFIEQLVVNLSRMFCDVRESDLIGQMSTGCYISAMKIVQKSLIQQNDSMPSSFFQSLNIHVDNLSKIEFQKDNKPYLPYTINRNIYIETQRFISDMRRSVVKVKH